MEAPPHKLKDVKDLLLTSWCQIQEHTFRGLVDLMPIQASAVLVTKGAPNLMLIVMADHCILVELLI